MWRTAVRGSLFGGGGEGPLGWSRCWGTRSSAAPVRPRLAPFPRAGSSPLPGLCFCRRCGAHPGRGSPAGSTRGSSCIPRPRRSFVPAVRRAGSRLTAEEGPLLLPLPSGAMCGRCCLACCYQHRRPWKLSFPACYFWLQHVIKSVP